MKSLLVSAPQRISVDRTEAIHRIDDEVTHTHIHTNEQRVERRENVHFEEEEGQIGDTSKWQTPGGQFQSK